MLKRQLQAELDECRAIIKHQNTHLRAKNAIISDLEAQLERGSIEDPRIKNLEESRDTKQSIIVDVLKANEALMNDQHLLIVMLSKSLNV